MSTAPVFKRRQILHAAGAATLGVALPAKAQADFPNRAIRIVLPLPAGGAADVGVRAIAMELEKGLKQTVLIENKPGGLFQIGVQAVSSAPADGHTILYIYSGMVSTQAIQKKFDLARQFRPITAISDSPTVLAVAANAKFKTVKQLVDFGRANPNKLTYSNLGPGSLEHLKTFQFTKAAGFEAMAVPYKGGPDAVRGLIGNEVDFIITPAFFALQFASKGQMIVLANMDNVRLKELPDVPSIVEAGVNVPPFKFWSGFLVPAQTPTPVVQRLHKEVLTALTSASVLERYAGMGSVVVTSKDPEELRAQIVAEAAWMGELAKQLNLDTQ